jgi:hypothetical protein
MMAAKSKNGAKPAGAAGAPSAGGEVSKMDAVRSALETQGKRAKPKAIVAFVKDRYGMDLSLNLVNNYKHHLVKKGVGKGRRGRRPKAEQAATASTPAAKRGNGGAISLRDIDAVKQLTDRVGAESLHSLIDMLAH